MQWAVKSGSAPATEVTGKIPAALRKLVNDAIPKGAPEELIGQAYILYNCYHKGGKTAVGKIIDRNLLAKGGHEPSAAEQRDITLHARVHGVLNVFHVQSPAKNGTISDRIRNHCHKALGIDLTVVNALITAIEELGMADGQAAALTESSLKRA